MMFEGKHIHFSPVDNRPLCSYSGKLCRQRRVNSYAFCIRHILEDKTAPFKQCAHVAKYNNQKCTNPIPSNENREFCNSHMQVAGMAPKKERKNKKEKESVIPSAPVPDGKLKFAERVKVLLKSDDLSPEDGDDADDPYTFSDVTTNSTTPSPKEMRHHLQPGATFGRLSVDGLPDTPCSFSSDYGGHKLESSRTNNCSSGSANDKSKSNGPTKSSKSVNRLEARIARNKILDKLKKNRSSVLTSSPCTRLDFSAAEIFDNPLVTETISSVIRACLESPSPPPCPSPPPPTATVASGSVKCEPAIATRSPQSTSGDQTLVSAVNAAASTLPVPGTSATTDSDLATRTTSVSIYASKCARRRTWRRPDAVSDALKDVQRLWEEKVTLTSDLFPLGLEGTDSDSDGSDVEIYQRHWFASPTDQDSWDDGKNGFLLRSINQNFAKSDFRRQCAQMRQSQSNMATSRIASRTLAQALVAASRSQPSSTARLLDSVSPSVQRMPDPKKLIKNTALSKQKCCYSNEESSCLAIALPYTRHCIKHIMYNVDQLLFEHCTAKFADNTQCCIPVFDVSHELPLCVEHARKRDNYSKMSSEPKPKKPRKKTKPSALTRPPKRGKKKKRQSLKLADVTNLSHESSTSQDLLPSVHYDSVSTGICHNTSVLHRVDVGHELNEQMDTDLSTDLVGQLSPGTIDKSLELPMDAVELANQASRLLEDHDFTEVLSKIPDEAFTELFNESKNGDLCHSKEAEELVRALASVDKDVKFSHEDQMELSEALMHGDLDLVSSGGLNLDSLHVITSSLSSSDLNSISQVLSSIAGGDGTLAHLPLLSDLVSSSGHNNNHHHHHHHHHNNHLLNNHHHHHHHHHHHLHQSDMTGGFSLRHDGVSTTTSTTSSSSVDQLVSSLAVGGDADSLSAAQWFDQYSLVHAPLLHNGLASSASGVTSPTHSGSAAASKYVSHSLTGISKLDAGSNAAKGLFHNSHHSYNSLGGSGGGGAGTNSFLENSHLNMGPMTMLELTDNSAESVS